MKISADYNEISQAAAALCSQSASYESTLCALNARMKEIQAVWQGEDGMAFQSQLETLKPKMMLLKESVDTYASLLAQCAAAYESLQANRTAGARML